MKQVISRKYPIPSLVEVGQARHDVSKHIYICIYPYRFTMLYIYIYVHVFITRTYLHPESFILLFWHPIPKKSIISGGCRQEMLRAKQVGQVLRALVDFASKHAVFEAGNRTNRNPNPGTRFGWIWAPAGQKTKFFFHRHCFFV